LDIDSWLREIGLAQYGELFRANDIDGKLLTGDDLKEIRVASLGHRKKLLEAIATLDAAPGVLSSSPVAATLATQAERRHLTVMFVDFVGSTALSTQLDPRTCAR
jgi:class 3 adenylate cyclase